MVEFYLLLEGGAGYLKAFTLFGGACRVEFDYVSVGQWPIATARKPWHEFSFDRAGHSFVVVSVFSDGGVAGSVPSPRIEVFEDGLNLRDGRTVDEWRQEAPAPSDPLPLMFNHGLPRNPVAILLILILAIPLVSAAVVALLRGRADAAVWLGVMVGWFAMTVLAQRWAVRHPYLGDRLRLAVVVSAYFWPLALAFLVAVGGGSSQATH